MILPGVRKCPFCRSENIGFARVFGAPVGWRCKDCGAKGPGIAVSADRSEGE